MALGIVLAALLATMVNVAARRSRSRVTTHPGDTEMTEVLPEPRPSPAGSSAPQRREVRSAPARSAAAQISGRVLAPVGEALAFDSLTCVPRSETLVLAAGANAVTVPCSHQSAIRIIGGAEGVEDDGTVEDDQALEHEKVIEDEVVVQ